MMTLPALLQAPPARQMRAGLERKYRVTVEQEAGDRYAYRLGVKVVAPQPPKGIVPKDVAAKPVESALRLELRLTDYQATVQEQEVRAPFLGGGEMEVEPTGLPKGLDVTGPLGPVWMPVLSFYRPTTEGDFTVSPLPVGPGLQLSGKGTWSAKRIDLDARLVVGEKEFGKLTLSTRLDGAGWPEHGEGTLVSADGTYHLRLDRA